MRHASTDAEGKLWKIVRDRRGSYIADFVCFERRLIVEADGSQHGVSRRDETRDAWFRSQGFRIRRFCNADFLLRPTEVKDTLWADFDGQMDL